ncbi:MAG: hypothetical protein KDK12_09295 [Rhodobacteraceae bacterium]|nr:hypothetical protein [Paracoccaceae bacterium]
MTRLRFITTATVAATLAAGAAGATTIVSTHGTNTLRIRQSPMGTVIHDGLGTHFIAPESEEPLVLRHTTARDTAHDRGGLSRMFSFLNFFDGFHRERPAAPAAVEDCFPPIGTHPRATMFDEDMGENRAAAMMRTMLHRLDR